MPNLMRCQFCGVLQDEPSGSKLCAQCGGELAYETRSRSESVDNYVRAELELDQVTAPGGCNIERHLLVTLRTPEQVPAAYQAQATTGRPPLNIAVVLDVSGSMQGPKIQQAVSAARQALNWLHPGDIFSLVTFSSEVHTLVEPVEISTATQSDISKILDQIRATGMTALYGGLEMGLKNALTKPRDTNLVLMLSDGQANVGETDLEKVGQSAFLGRQANITVSTLGVGTDYNEALMVEIATQGGGRYYHIQHPRQIPAYLTGEMGEMAALAARSARLELDVSAGVTVLPLIAAYHALQENDKAIIQIGDLPADLELEIPLRIAIPAHPAGSRLSFQGRLHYHAPSGAALSTVLNRVTVRFVEAPSFQLRDGVVAPVVERVLEQMKAASVLAMSRQHALDPAASVAQRQRRLDEVRTYATLLGEARAEQEASATDIDLSVIAASPAAAKEAVARSYQVSRKTRNFDNDKA